MLNYEIYDLTQALQGALFQDAFTPYQSDSDEDDQAKNNVPPVILQLRRGYAESPAWIMAQIQEFYPEPLTVEKFRIRAVYSAPNLILGFLELLASEKWLDRRSDGYHITKNGQQHIDGLRNRGRKIFGSYESTHQSAIKQLYEMFELIIEASLQTGHPPGTWSLEHSRQRAPDDDASDIHKLVHFFSDLNAFRDDCHMAAYLPYSVAGHEWEALGFVADENAHTADELFDHLAYRGFSRMDWQAALDNLEKLEWISRAENGANITAEGQRVRQQVEALTDQYFFAPWQQVLSEERIEHIVKLMHEIHDEIAARL